MKNFEQSFSETGKLPCLAKTKECENKNITVTCNNMRMKILWHFVNGFGFSSCSEFWVAKVLTRCYLGLFPPVSTTLTDILILGASSLKIPWRCFARTALGVAWMKQTALLGLYQEVLVMCFYFHLCSVWNSRGLWSGVRPLSAFSHCFSNPLTSDCCSL